MSTTRDLIRFARVISGFHEARRLEEKLIARGFRLIPQGEPLKPHAYRARYRWRHGRMPRADFDHAEIEYLAKEEVA